MAVYSVSEVSRYLTEILREDPVLQNVWVRGEVGNLTRSAAGHSYFSLRDAGATLRCVMFRGGGVGADLIEEGSAVIAHGRVALYEPRGDLQLIADVVQPEGVGELQLKLEELKMRLEKEGLFEESRKRPLAEISRARGSRHLADRLRLARHSKRDDPPVPGRRARACSGAGAGQRGGAHHRCGVRRAGTAR